MLIDQKRFGSDTSQRRRSMGLRQASLGKEEKQEAALKSVVGPIHRCALPPKPRELLASALNLGGLMAHGPPCPIERIGVGDDLVLLSNRRDVTVVADPHRPFQLGITLGAAMRRWSLR